MTPFWQGFFKKADAGDGGGGFFGGAGKGQTMGNSEQSERMGPVGNDGDGAPTTDKTLIDRERGPRSDSMFETGPTFYDEALHVVY